MTRLRLRITWTEGDPRPPGRQEPPVRQSLALKPIATIIQHHHERWDGTGYPDGLRGETIPLEARIVGVCDAVHVMSMNRPYRLALNSQHILQELDRCAGSQFDPRLVSLLKEAKSFRR